jgi:hypothetical protein
VRANTIAGREIEDLLALNREYIDSIQHRDAARFEEILAEDFLCSNASGEQRHGRYTDVWQRRAGTWLAVSAHVTR